TATFDRTKSHIKVGLLAAEDRRGQPFTSEPRIESLDSQVKRFSLHQGDAVEAEFPFIFHEEGTYRLRITVKHNLDRQDVRRTTRDVRVLVRSDGKGSIKVSEFL